MSEAMFVFTVEEPNLILRQGGTQSWKVSHRRARECEYEYVVCVQNQRVEDRAWCRPTEPHGTAFLIGHISEVVPSAEQGRFLVKIRDFAIISVPNVWQGWRFPIRYMPLADVGIDPDTLEFQPVPAPSADSMPANERPNRPVAGSIPPVSLSDALFDAKRALAARLGISAAAIEITIRG